MTHSVCDQGHRELEVPVVSPKDFEKQLPNTVSPCLVTGREYLYPSYRSCDCFEIFKKKREKMELIKYKDCTELPDYDRL